MNQSARIIPVFKHRADDPNRPRRVLFISEHNAVRGQMAVGLMTLLGGLSFEIYGCGFDPRPVHTLTIDVMADHGFNIDRQPCHSIQNYAGWEFDFVVTLAEGLQNRCPIFHAAADTLNMLHWPLPDPLKIADEEARLDAFYAIADDLRGRITRWVGTLREPKIIQDIDLEF